MNKCSKDKIFATAFGGLLGYYLSISFFSYPKLFTLILPPINDRHLPFSIYSGLTGALIGAVVILIIFALTVERKSFGSYKNQYIIAVLTLILIPLIMMGIFRIHAVNYITNAEKTIPTNINIHLHAPRTKIMFNESQGSASGFSKEIAIEADLLEEAGHCIREMELKEVVEDKDISEDYQTLFISYQVKDKWYSKILTHNNGVFKESVANNRIAVYESKGLQELIEKSISRAGNLASYDKGIVFDYKSMIVDNKGKELSKQDFKRLREFVISGKKIDETNERTSNIKIALENGISQDMNNLYAISLIRGNKRNSGTENFMVYDKESKILFYEGKFYDMDLSGMI